MAGLESGAVPEPVSRAAGMENQDLHDPELETDEDVASNADAIAALQAKKPPQNA
jgi:hypothetical protein